MQPTRWNKRRVSALIAGFLVIYLFFTAKYNTYKLDVTIRNTKPEQVWEYVADFSKMRLLNPTILDFSVTADHGNTHHWKYSVVYRERLSHWPYWINTATAHFNVRKTHLNKGANVVESEHKTCFFRGWYCLNSNSEFTFTARGDDTYCMETVHYQCPPFLGAVCRREVEFQRKAIMSNLTLQFSKRT